MPIYETSSAEQVAWILADSGAVGGGRRDGRARRRDRAAAESAASSRMWRIEPAPDLAGAVDELVALGADTRRRG